MSRAEAPSAKQTSRPQQPRSSHFLSARWPRRRRSIRRSVTSHASQQLRPPYSSPFRSADALSAEPQKLCSPRRSIVRRAAAPPTAAPPTTPAPELCPPRRSPARCAATPPAAPQAGPSLAAALSAQQPPPTAPQPRPPRRSPV